MFDGKAFGAEVVETVRGFLTRSVQPIEARLAAVEAAGLGEVSVDFDGERTATIKFTRGEVVREFPITLPTIIDRGVWRDGAFAKGDAVTLGGSLWIAQRDTSEKPGEGATDWRLAVKRGRDGKDGQSIKGDPGPPGRPGRDLTQIGPDGAKW